jgi:hypothetical protein
MQKSQKSEIHPPERVKTVRGASGFIDSVGFCVLFPVKNVPLPSLYYAVAKRRPTGWDKYSQLVWKWKDELPKKHRAYYGKYFRARGSFLSLRFLPYFLALHGSAANPGEAGAYYQAGRISLDALELWQALGKHGPLPTLELRHACQMETQAGNKRFKKAIVELQGLLIVTHSGAEQETGAWASSRFDLVARCFPEQVAEARHIRIEEARAAIAAKYRAFDPAAGPAQIARLFGWTKAQAVSALAL